jgi:vitamin B12 transporter
MRTYVPTKLERAISAVIALGGAVLAGDGAIAQDRVSADDPGIVVTATRIPTLASEVASTIAVITAEEIERRQYRSVGEALNSLPSLSVVRSGALGKTTALFARGSNGNHSLVLIDGIEATDPSTTDGRTDFGLLAIGDVARIEVLYGSQGTLYGSDAIGAVVNIITRTGKGPASGYASAEGGSFGTFNQSAGVSGSVRRLSYAFDAQHLYNDGLSATDKDQAPPGRTNDDDRHESLTLSTRLGLEATDSLGFSFAGRYIRSENDLDLNTSAIQSDDDSRDRSTAAFLRGEVRLDALDGAVETRLGVAYSYYARVTIDNFDPVNPLDSLTDDNIGTRTKIDLKTDFRAVEGHVFTLGLETEEESIDSNLVSASAFGPFTSSTEAEARTNAVFVQDQVSFAGRYFAALGVRVDDHETFGREVTWRAAPAYLHRETGTKLRGSYATGFKAPTLFQLHVNSISAFGVFMGNPNLKPEESRTWEVGIDQELWGGRAAFGVGYFDSTVKNLISPGATQNVNLGRADLEGIETYIRAKIASDVEARADYAYIRPVNADNGQDLNRRPRHKASAEIAWRPVEDVRLAATGIYVGRRNDVDAFSFAVKKVPSHSLVNLAASWDVVPALRLFARIENLLDRHYEDPDGFVQPGLGAFAGVRARF